MTPIIRIPASTSRRDRAKLAALDLAVAALRRVSVAAWTAGETADLRASVIRARLCARDAHPAGRDGRWGR